MTYMDSKHTVELIKLISNNTTKELHCPDYEHLYDDIGELLVDCTVDLWDILDNKLRYDEGDNDNFSISDIKNVFDLNKFENILNARKIDTSDDFRKKLVVYLNNWLLETFKEWEDCQDNEYLIKKWEYFCGRYIISPF